MTAPVPVALAAAALDIPVTPAGSDVVAVFMPKPKSEPTATLPLDSVEAPDFTVTSPLEPAAVVASVANEADLPPDSIREPPLPETPAAAVNEAEPLS